MTYRRYPLASHFISQLWIIFRIAYYMSQWDSSYFFSNPHWIKIYAYSRDESSNTVSNPLFARYISVSTSQMVVVTAIVFHVWIDFSLKWNVSNTCLHWILLIMNWYSILNKRITMSMKFITCLFEVKNSRIINYVNNCGRGFLDILMVIPLSYPLKTYIVSIDYSANYGFDLIWKTLQII